MGLNSNLNKTHISKPAKAPYHYSVICQMKNARELNIIQYYTFKKKI